MDSENNSSDDEASLSFRYLENRQLYKEDDDDDIQWPRPSPSHELLFFFSDFSAENRGGEIDLAVQSSGAQGIRDYFRSRSFSGKRETTGSVQASRLNRFGSRDGSLLASQKVNISSLTSMSAKSRRRMFMFGPVKFKPEMDLVEIKERQRRLSPKEVLPVAGAGGATAAEIGGGELETVKLIGCGTRRHNLSTVLAKPFVSCFTVTVTE